MGDVTVTFSARYARFMQQRVMAHHEMWTDLVADNARCDRASGITSVAQLAPVEQVFAIRTRESLEAAESMLAQAADWGEDDGVCVLTAPDGALEDLIVCTVGDADNCTLGTKLDANFFAWVDLVGLIGDLGGQVRDARRRD